MARAGGGKVVSSGRISVPVRPLSTKKRAATRKISTTSADSGYSLCSTDSEDQVVFINKGLDRCAALLQDILESEARDNKSKPHKATFPKAHLKSSCRIKKIAAKKPSTASHVNKEKVNVRKSVPSRGFHIEVQGPPVNVSSPVLPTMTCDRVQTQMQLLNMAACKAASAPAPESAVLFNCRLPTSTPAASPPPPANPPVAGHGVYRQPLSQGGAVHFPSALTSQCMRRSVPPAACNIQEPVQQTFTAPSAACNVQSAVQQTYTTACNVQAPVQQTYTAACNVQAPVQQTYTAPSAACNVQAPVQQTYTAPSAACNVQQTYTAPSTYQSTHQADMLAQPSNSKIQDSDLLQYLAAHLAQLRSQGVTYTPVPENEGVIETEEPSSDEEEVTIVDKAAARDISCQTSFSNQKKSSPEKTERKIRTVKYLLGEIKALVADQDDGEALRLVTELEHNVSLLPGVVGGTNVHAEIALALQPLRSENAQLRRRLRILNQQLRDRERTARSDEQSCEVTSLQSMNETLQQQLMEVHKSLASQQNKNEELLKVVEAQKEENKSLSQIIREKEQEILQLRQQSDITSSSLQIKANDVMGNTKSLQFKLESAEKENRILGITLRQRDTEVGRLRDLTRTLQASMAKLLCDLGKDNARARPGAPLTQAALDSYEKQLRTDQCPASTSIISYLKRLEMDQVIPCSSDQPDQGLTSDPSDDFVITKGHITCPRPEATAPSVPPHSPQKLRAEVTSDFCSLISDEYKPDETTYLPMASSPHKANFVPSSRLMCTPPKACWAERDAGDKINVFGASERDRQSQRSLFNALDQSDKPTGVPKPNEPPGGHPPLLHHPRNLRVGDRILNDQSVVDVTPTTSDWSIASFSTFTSHDEQDFRNGLAALDANIAKLQRTLQSSVTK